MSQEVKGKIAPESEDGGLTDAVKCDWLSCEGGLGLAGSGVCHLHGEWDNPNCPQFLSRDSPLGKTATHGFGTHLKTRWKV